jgi:predicted CoA-binding protein
MSEVMTETSEQFAARHAKYDDALIRRILRENKTIAMVGASANWNRPSYFAMKYLQEKGFRIIPVNPREAGKDILSETVRASLKDVPEKIDLVDCFRSADAIPAIADEAIEVGAKVLWMQLGIRNEEAARKAEAAGLTVIMNRCPKIEYGRLSGEINWIGVPTRIISAKRSSKV